jgi:hypothetical protein
MTKYFICTVGFETDSGTAAQFAQTASPIVQALQYSTIIVLVRTM